MVCVHVKNKKKRRKKMEGIYAEELGVFPLGFMVCFASLQVLPSTLFYC